MIYLKGVIEGEKIFKYSPSFFAQMNSEDLTLHVDMCISLMQTKQSEFWKGYRDAIEHHIGNYSRELENIGKR